MGVGGLKRYSKLVRHPRKISEIYQLEMIQRSYGFWIKEGENYYMFGVFLKR